MKQNLILSNLRCPCCNEELDEYEIEMYDIFEGWKEECFSRSMEAAHDQDSLRILKESDIDLGGC
jgi:hypothetical protein